VLSKRLKNWILAYYLKIFLNKGEIPSKHINSICKYSKVLMLTIKKHPNKFKKVLEVLIQIVNLNKMNLALSKLFKVENRKICNIITNLLEKTKDI